MNGARRTIGLALLGLLAFGLRLWVVLALPTAQEHPGWTLAGQLLQCAAGTALVLTVAWLAWSLLPDRPSVGWVAALGAAIYAPHVQMAAALGVGPWAALVLTLLLAVVLSSFWQATRRRAALAGCLAGLLFALEPILVLALPICAAVFWLGDSGPTWSGRFARAALGRLGLLAGVAAMIALPWMVRNRLVEGRFLLTKPAQQSADEQSPSYGQLCVQRLESLLLFDEANPATRDRSSRIAAVAWLVLAVIGLSVSRSRWRALWPTYAVFAAVALVHTLVVASPALRPALEPMTFVWASTAVAPLVVRLLPQRRIKIHRPGQQAHDPFGAEHVLQGPHYDIPVRRRAG